MGPLAEGLRIALPWPLVGGLLGALVLFVGALEARGDGTIARRAARTAVRALVLGLVGLAVCHPTLERAGSAARRLVVVVDPSSLATEEGRAATSALFARAASAATRDGMRLDGLLAASGTPAFDPRGPGVPPGATAPGSLAAALGAAALRIGAADAGAVLVLSDGRADATGAPEAAKALRDAGVPVRAVVVPPPRTTGPGPAIQTLDVPDEVRGPFAVRVAAASPRPATARLFVDGVEKASRPVRTSDDEHPDELVFDDLVVPPGLHEVAVSVEPPDAAAGAGRGRPARSPARCCSCARRPARSTCRTPRRRRSRGARCRPRASRSWPSRRATRPTRSAARPPTSSCSTRTRPRRCPTRRPRRSRDACARAWACSCSRAPTPEPGAGSPGGRSPTSGR